jgi:hypothetical protein
MNEPGEGLFQKHIVLAKLDIYVFISRYILKFQINREFLWLGIHSVI